MESGQTPKLSRCDAFRDIDDGCSRAISACIDMMDAAAAIGVMDELYAVREALLRLHALSALSVEYSTGLLRH